MPEGSEVAPRRYLADTAAAAQAIRDFSAALGQVGPTAAPARLRAAAPDMGDALGRAELATGRLAAERLEDQRLESQRQETVVLLRRVLEAMRETHAAAQAGQARRSVAATEALADAVAALRAAGA